MPAAAVVIAVLLPLAGLLVVTLLSGHHLEVVEAGSMRPTYDLGTLLVVEPIDPSDVRVGMPLSFVSEGSGHRVTHRVTAVLERDTGLYFRTQGDANRAPDADPVPARAVRGQVRWAIPHLGSVLLWLAWPRGAVLLVVAPAVALAAAEGLAMRRRRRDRGTAHGDELFDDRYAVL
jgi:signal peptidase